MLHINIFKLRDFHHHKCKNNYELTVFEEMENDQPFPDLKSIVLLSHPSICGLCG